MGHGIRTVLDKNNNKQNMATTTFGNHEKWIANYEDDFEHFQYVVGTATTFDSATAVCHPYTATTTTTSITASNHNQNDQHHHLWQYNERFDNTT
jgi:hypothetical protein